MFGSFAQRMVDGQGLTQPLLEQDQGRRRHDRGMVHRRLPFKLNVERTGLSFWRLIFSDVFQYLLDMPLWRFVIVVFISYAAFYMSFGVVYYWQAEDCIIGIQTFDHAVWFSVQSAATIGFGGDMAPNPDCFVVNFTVAVQTVVMVLLNTFLMGVIFARFSSPMHRTQVIQFSRGLAMHVHGDRMCLSCRVANLKAHGMMNPHVRMIVTSLLLEELQKERDLLDRTATVAEVMDVDEDPSTQSVLGSSSTHQQARPLGPSVGVMELKVDALPESLLHLTLGLPATLTHVIDEESPLYGLSKSDFAEFGLEVMVLLEGVDPATSHHVQARRSYGPENIRYGHRFARIVTVRRRSIGPNLPNFPRIRAASMHLNFANFDTTVDEDGVLFPPPSPKALPDSTDTRMRSALVRGASRMSPLSAQGMGGRGEGAGSGGGSAEEQLRVQHYELRLEGGDERRLQALWELMRMAQDPMTHATRPTLVLCRLKPDVDTVVRCLRSHGFRGVHCVAERGEDSNGRASISDFVVQGKTTVLVAWVGYAQQLIREHLSAVCLQVYFRVPSPEVYLTRCALVRDGGCVFTLSEGSDAEVQWIAQIKSKVPSMGTFDIEANKDEVSQLLQGLHTSASTGSLRP